MRYIGNKENIINIIYNILQQNHVQGCSFFDFFSGTANVGKYFKEKGYKVISCDILYLSYCLQKAYIENNHEPLFISLLSTLPIEYSDNSSLSPLNIIVNYLNNLAPTEGFIYQNYTPSGTVNLVQQRKYFTDNNGKKIDAIRIQIENWKNQYLISESEYFILIACLIETIGFYSNITGVYAAFQKQWDPRALKELELRTISFIDNKQQNKVYNTDSMNLLEKIDTDILYLDPPYNARQYAPNYHILETIAKYDNPNIKGTTGMRDYKSQKSRFCNAKTALEDLDIIANKSNCKYMVLSYNSEGIMPQDDILKILNKYGNTTVEQFEYIRFKSNNNGLSKTQKHVFEQLYILEKI